MRLNKLSIFGLGVALCAAPAFAASVTGQANISGTAVVDSSGIYFGTDLSGAPNSVVVSAPNTGSFSGLSTAFIQDLLGPAQTGTLANPIPAFAIFNVTSGVVDFNLTGIDPGYGSAAGCASNTMGNICTPPGSPFTLTQTQTMQGTPEVLLSLSLSGNAFLNSSADGSSPVAAGIFSTQNLVPGTITDILAAAATTGGFTNSFSATFTATPGAAVPEPASLLLMGVGLLGAGLVARRKVRS